MAPRIGKVGIIGFLTALVPVAAPFFVQAPFARPATTLWKYRGTIDGRNTLRRASGDDLPEHVAAGPTRHLGRINTRHRMPHGTCRLTDTGCYAALSKRMPPQDLPASMNHCPEVRLGPPGARGGSVSGVTGDAIPASRVTARPQRPRPRGGIIRLEGKQR